MLDRVLRPCRRILLALAVVAAPTAALAQSGRVSDVFEVRGVNVDVTAETAVQAKDRAYLAGRQQALNELLRRLTLSAHHAGLPNASGSQWDALIRTYQVENEKLSATRYIASLRFRFAPDPVRSLLRQAEIPFSESRSKPVIVLPVFGPPSAARLFEADNPWLLAWRSRAGSADDLVALQLPKGDPQDISTIDAYGALEANGTAMRALGRRYGAERIAVAYAAAGSNLVSLDVPRLLVHLKIYGGTQSSDLLEKFEAAEGEDAEALYARAISRISAWVSDDWKRETLLEFTDITALEVTAKLASFRDWLQLQRGFARIANISGWEIRSISTARADLTLRYQGNVQQLATLLSQQDIRLIEDVRGWRLEFAGAGGVIERTTKAK